MSEQRQCDAETKSATWSLHPRCTRRGKFEWKALNGKTVYLCGTHFRMEPRRRWLRPDWAKTP